MIWAMIFVLHQLKDEWMTNLHDCENYIIFFFEYYYNQYVYL